MRIKQLKILTFTCLTIIILQWGFSPGILANQGDPVSNVQEKLQGISDEEKQVLRSLFTLTHDIEEMETEQQELGQEIEWLNHEIAELETAIANEESIYNQKLDVLRQVLKAYQRKGPGSYLEIILDSENLNMLLWRITTLQDLSRNTGSLLKSLEEGKRKLADERNALAEKLVSVKDKQKQLSEALEKNLKLKQQMEEYLASLNEDREHYLEQLGNLQQVWGRLKLYFSDAAEEFISIIRQGNLPPDAVKTTFTFHGIEGVIEEDTFNSIVSGNPHLSDMAFSFHDGRMELEVAEMELVLKGTFGIDDGNMLRFIAEEGSFYSMPLEPNTIAELFKDGSLSLDLKPLVGKSRLNSVEISEDCLKFVINPIF